MEVPSIWKNGSPMVVCQFCGDLRMRLLSLSRILVCAHEARGGEGVRASSRLRGREGSEGRRSVAERTFCPAYASGKWSAHSKNGGVRTVQGGFVGCF